MAIMGYSDSIGIAAYQISGVAETVKSTQQNLTNSLTFQLDINGIPSLLEAETKYTKEEQTKKKGSDEMQLKNKTHKFPLEFKQLWIELPIVLNGTETREITNRLKQFKDEDEQRQAIVALRNDLESYLYFCKDKRGEDVFNGILSI